MEFKFRSFNERSSTYSYFTQEAMRAGFSSREFPRNPNGAVRDAMQRELDKERIRAEIIAEEIVRRRVLEEEVRREMMIEREMALRFEPRLPLLTYAEGWDRFGVGVSPHREVGFETPSFQRNSRAAGTENGNSSGITLQEIKEIKGHVLDVKNDKFIILAKPNANPTDIKRKATTPPGGDDEELTSAGLKKHKTKDDLSCSVCGITATSERALSEHRQGKKHKARERGLVAQRMGFGVDPLPKEIISNTTKPIKVLGITSTLVKNDEKVPAQKTTGAEDAILQGEKKENWEAPMPQITPTTKPKKKFRYWCETCQVGAHSQKVMNSHKRGKKHIAKLPVSGNSSAEHVAAEQKKECNMAAEQIKQEAFAEQVGSKEGPTTEEKDKVVENVCGNEITEQVNFQVLASNDDTDP